MAICVAAAEARIAHHGDVGIGDRQDAGAAPRGGRDGAQRLVAANAGNDGMSGQEGCQMFGDADRAHARTTAAVRDGEGLVQIQVAHVGADDSRGR